VRTGRGPRRGGFRWKVPAERDLSSESRFRLPGAAGVCAALLPPEAGGPPSAELAAQVEAYAARLPAAARHGLRAGVAGVQALSVATTGRRLERLPVDRREAVLERLAARPETAHAVEGLKAMVLLVGGAHQRAAEMLAHAAATEPARPDPVLDVTASSGWPDSARADVVVIGSGAGGAMVARTLARAGASVVVLEEGRRYSVHEFRTRHPLDRFADLYRDAGATFALGRPPVALPLGRGVGGSTLVNSGTCYRPPSDVLERWRDQCGVKLADPPALAPYLDEVERTLDVASVPAAVMGRNGELLLAGAQRLGWTAAPLLRNAPGCGGCCQCAIGCPRNAKLGVHLNALPEACAAGARVVSEARVDRLVVDAGERPAWWPAGPTARGSSSVPAPWWSRPAPPRRLRCSAAAGSAHTRRWDATWPCTRRWGRPAASPTPWWRGRVCSRARRSRSSTAARGSSSRPPRPHRAWGR